MKSPGCDRVLGETDNLIFANKSKATVCKDSRKADVNESTSNMYSAEVLGDSVI